MVAVDVGDADARQVMHGQGRALQAMLGGLAAIDQPPVAVQ
jgi:hypothetical protein